MTTSISVYHIKKNYRRNKIEIVLANIVGFNTMNSLNLHFDYTRRKHKFLSDGFFFHNCSRQNLKKGPLLMILYFKNQYLNAGYPRHRLIFHLYFKRHAIAKKK